MPHYLLGSELYCGLICILYFARSMTAKTNGFKFGLNMIDGNFHVLMYTQNLVFSSITFSKDWNRIPRGVQRILPNRDDEYAKIIGLVNILCPKLGKQLLCMCCTKSEGYRVYFFSLLKSLLYALRGICISMYRLFCVVKCGTIVWCLYLNLVFIFIQGYK